MGVAIRNLLVLQEVDLQIISLNDERAKLLDSTTRKKSEAEEKRRQFEEREKTLKQLKVEMKHAEVELAGYADHIRKLEGQQIHVKTNQEYKALDKEIYEAKAHKTRSEDQILQKMEHVERETEGIREGRRQLDAQLSQLQGELSAAEEKIREIDARMVDLRAKRFEAAKSVEEVHLALYNRIFNKKRIPVIVPLVNRTCQGCHLAVTAAVESILRRHAAHIITCENCSRILYVPEEEDAP